MVTVHGIANGTSDGAANRKMNRLFVPSERRNPTNQQFERHVARLERQQQQQLQQQQQRRIFFSTFFPDILYHVSETTSPVIILHVNLSEEPRNYLANQSRLLAERSTNSDSMSNSEFLHNISTKTRTDARHTTRRKSKKKSKKHRQHFRKLTVGSEIPCTESDISTPSVDMIDSCEGSALSPKHVGDILFEETFSPSSSVKEASEKAPDSENDNEYNGCSVASVSSASYCDETELSRPTTSCLELFGQCGSNNYRYLDNIPNLELMDSSQEPRQASRSGDCSGKIKTLSSSRNERGHSPCEMAEFSSSSDGADDNWLENFNSSSDFSSENGVGGCNGAQAVHLCSDGSRGSDFCLVISRKRARKEKKMSMSKSFNGEHASAVTHGPDEKYTGHSSRQMIKELNTKECSHRQDHVDSIQPQHGVVLKRSIKNFIHKRSNGIPFKHSESGTSRNHSTSPKENSNSKSNAESGTGPNHFTSPKQNSNIKSNGNFDKEQNTDLNKGLSNGLHCRESTSCEMRSNSASEPTISESAKGNCTSESSQLTDHVVGDFPMLKRGLQGSLRVNYAIGTVSGLPSPDSKSTKSDLLVGCGGSPFVDGNHSFEKFSSSEMHLIQMTKVVNDAYEVQVAADAHMSAGYPITDLEILMHSATPVIRPVSCVKISNSSQDQSVRSSICQQYMSNIYLRNIWGWYEEPGCYGLEVRDLNARSSVTPHHTSSEFCAYFVPYLSAIQLFGWSTKNKDNGFGVGDMLGASSTTSLLSSQPVPVKLHEPFEQSNTFFSESSFSTHDHGELIFEYFETEQPSFRPPLFEKIKELSSLNLSGDSEKLQNVKLCDLHPASWYCVAWYPIYRVPHGSFRASFLTYHSLGKLVPQMSSPDLSGGQHTRIVCPVVGLQGYNDKGEQWLELRCPDSLKPSGAEVLKERLRTLRRGALAMARAVIPRGSDESSVNHHPDYEFFLSRST